MSVRHLAAAIAVALAASKPMVPAGAAQAAKADVAIKPAASCSSLSGFDLTGIGGAGSRVTKAAEEAGQAGAVCTVEGVLAPSIGLRVELPTTSWTGRFLQIGCGGLCGQVSLKPFAVKGCVPFERNELALAATDMGHEGRGGEFGRDAQLREDFAYRGVHLTAVAAKALIARFYGRPQAKSYFSGCSDGGREALMEAQRFPEDFDGIVAGAPAMNFQVQNSLYHGWQARSNTGPDGKPVLLAARLPVLHRAVLAKCDALDGQSDGILADPRACSFDPATVQCQASQSDHGACLTPAEVDTVRKLYAGPADPRTGVRLTAGGPQFGSELAWAGVFVPESADQPIFSTIIALDALRNLIFDTETPKTFGLGDLDFTEATFARLKPRHALFDATNPDISAFVRRGGKLILFHGWSDPHISPLNIIAYHEAVRRTLGREQAHESERLYLLPGVYHCEGGEGPSEVDLLSPIIAWVEQGTAPDAVVAKQPASAGFPAGRSRPLYPYPALAAYAGSGDVNDAANYRPTAATVKAEMPAWAGSSFFEPYRFRLH